MSRLITLVVLWRQLSNPTSPPLIRSIRAFRQLDVCRPRSCARSRQRPGRSLTLNAAQLQQLVLCYQAGATVYDLTPQFGLDRRTVGTLLKRQGVPLRGRRPTQVEVNDMTTLYNQGLSLATVGQRLGFTARTVQLHLRDRGVQMRDTHGRPRPHPT